MTLIRLSRLLAFLAVLIVAPGLVRAEWIEGQVAAIGIGKFFYTDVVYIDFVPSGNLVLEECDSGRVVLFSGANALDVSAYNKAFVLTLMAYKSGRSLRLYVGDISAGSGYCVAKNVVDSGTSYHSSVEIVRQ